MIIIITTTDVTPQRLVIAAHAHVAGVVHARDLGRRIVRNATTMTMILARACVARALDLVVGTAMTATVVNAGPALHHLDGRRRH